MTKRSQAPLLALPAEFDARVGVRDRIYAACLAAIRDGTLAAGRRLPSSRQLAADWRVARNTVDDALAQLQAEGMIVRRVGDGTFVAPGVAARPAVTHARHRQLATVGRRALEAASARGAAAARQFASSSIPQAAPFVAGMAALDAFPIGTWRRLAASRWRSDGDSLLGYLPAAGYPPLQSAIAGHLATARAIRCLPEQVMIVNSTMQAVDLIARVLVERDDVAWTEDPCYPNLRAVLAMAGIRVVPLPVDAEGLAFDGVAATAKPPALIFVTPSCQYPTGVAMSVARRLALLRVAEQSRAWIVEDDHQVEFTWSARPAAPVFALDRSARTLYAGTFSHTIFPSLRLAYVVLPLALVDVFHAVRRQMDDHTHGFMQAVLADFIAGGHFSAHLRSMRTLYARRHDALYAALSRDGLRDLAATGPGCGMHATLDLPLRVGDAAAAASAARAGIRVQPLTRYSAGVSKRNGLLLGYAALSERRIGAGVARLARVLHRLGPGRPRRT